MDKQPQQEPLTEEEFLELVLAEQERALEEERQRRLNGQLKKPRQRPMIRLIVYVMAFALIFNTFAIIFQIYSIPAIEFIKVSAKLSQQENIQQYKKAVVEISSENSKGTGFAISADGYIMTNEHVIDDALALTVVFPDNGLYKARVIASNPEVDLAILKVETEVELPYLPLADAFQANKQHVYVIGNPLYFTGIANEGVVLEPLQLKDWQEQVIMLQAPIYKGNSGSPVLTEDGQVVGVVFATTKHDEHGRIGLFIPIELVHRELLSIEDFVK
ncbi:S1C family serine protease [Metasolibacillus meyeri]|uniref:S1C family serine protease n=1 Tax=Metasolibacillus meyeri TaxID=1071052 RepID=UPI000D302B76|nr:serine protease [Metasolibacillus meyeri]